MLQRHYQLLGKMSVDSVFDADWKEEVGDNVMVMCLSMLAPPPRTGWGIFLVWNGRLAPGVGILSHLSAPAKHAVRVPSRFEF